MTPKEFAIWLDYHGTRFASVRERFEKMAPDIRGLNMAAWSEAVADLTLDDAQAATDAIFKDPNARPYGFDAHPAAVRKTALAMVQAREAQDGSPILATYRPNARLRGRPVHPLRGKKNQGMTEAVQRVQAHWDQQDADRDSGAVSARGRSVGGLPTYTCHWCQDSGLVAVWHPIMSDAALDGVDDVIYETMAMPCFCDHGEKAGGTREGCTRFEPARMVKHDGLGGVAEYIRQREGQRDLVANMPPTQRDLDDLDPYWNN